MTRERKIYDAAFKFIAVELNNEQFIQQMQSIMEY